MAFHAGDKTGVLTPTPVALKPGESNITLRVLVREQNVSFCPQMPCDALRGYAIRAVDKIRWEDRMRYTVDKRHAAGIVA
eukprot:COSAG06_NODE_50534_length_318_cov_0.698630_1_plen_79_part_10